MCHYNNISAQKCQARTFLSESLRRRPRTAISFKKMAFSGPPAFSAPLREFSHFRRTCLVNKFYHLVLYFKLYQVGRVYFLYLLSPYCERIVYM